MTLFRFRLLGLLSALTLVGAGAVQAQTVAVDPTSATCPDALPDGARCFSGRSEAGAFYWIAYPADWNGTLIVHSHGGPRLGEPEADDPVADLSRFSVMVSEGYAWAGSTYRRGGYGVRMAARDTDDLRQIVWGRFGKPQRTLLHGQSWGGNVAAKTAELYAVAADGTRNYNGVLLTSGVLAGGTRAYDFRADLRAVYQHYCHNHPRPDEVQYPVWQGLPRDATMSRAEIAARVDECTGAGLAPEARTPLQASNLRSILSVTGVQADQLVSHMAWPTTLFQDMIWNRLDGRNPFSNVGVTYQGSDDDVALNQGVERFDADPSAVAALAYDSDLTGQIMLPTLTLHARYDPTAFVWHEAAYRETVAAAGRSDLLVQTFTTEHEHSQLSAPQYAALLEAMSQWISDGDRPTAAAIARRCEGLSERYDEPCLFDVGFQPSIPQP